MSTRMTLPAALEPLSDDYRRIEVIVAALALGEEFAIRVDLADELVRICSLAEDAKEQAIYSALEKLAPTTARQMRESSELLGRAMAPIRRATRLGVPIELLELDRGRFEYDLETFVTLLEDHLRLERTKLFSTVSRLSVEDEGRLLEALRLARRDAHEYLHSPEVRLVADVMTPDPEIVTPDEKIAVAARKMRDAGVGDVIVADEGVVVGILTDRDIVVRLVAVGGDPKHSRVADVCSRSELALLAPNDSIGQAIDLIRDKAVRRLPVVDGGRPVGIVSLGDLALARDPSSALSDVCAAPPNT